ncbi:ABC transporter permease [Candidatus Sumerlaeota bacterium]|nr:ABC transporter permease [Candidatus Sumerlaeota bacterium]
MGALSQSTVDSPPPLAPGAEPASPARLWAARGLLLTLVKRDIKVKYKESFLGFFWSFAKPLFLMIILTIVFKKVVKLPLSNPLVPYELHLLVGLIPWLLLLNGLADAMHSIVANSNLLKKVQVTAEVFPLAAVMSNTVHFGFSLIVLGGFLAWYGIGLDTPIVLLPVALGIQLVFMVGLALLLSSLSVVFRDIVSIFEVLTTGWFYATPIFYDYGLFAGFIRDNPEYAWAHWVFALNPMVGITAAYRRALLYNGERAAQGGLEMSDALLFQHLVVSLAMAVAVLIIGMLVFRRLRGVFADRL